MKRYFKSTPGETRDLIYAECHAHNLVRERLSRLFSGYGYREVMTPTLEYYDLFCRDSAGMPEETLYKLSDLDGRLLVLRPDITLPIARLVSTRLKNEELPLRLYYTEQVYRSNPKMRGKSDEIFQSGVELIGANGLKSDLELLAIALESFKACDVHDYRIEIGHAELFKSLAEQISDEEDFIEDARYYIEAKNEGALENILRELPDSPAKQAMRLLPSMFGGDEVFDKIAPYCNDRMMDSIQYLRKVYGYFVKIGLQDKVTLDLGLVHRNHYYTGLVFRGYIMGQGDAVLSGGRYDNLLSEFESPMPATGFALDHRALAGHLMQTNQMYYKNTPDILVFGEPGYEMQAAIDARSMVKGGKMCEVYTGPDMDSAIDYARRNHIGVLAVVGREIRSIKVRETI